MTPSRQSDMSDIVERLRELSHAVTLGEKGRSEFTMRVPVDEERDADIVLSNAADEIESLRADKERLEGLIVAYKESLDTYEQVLETHGHDAAKKHLYPAIDNIVAEGDRIRKEREKGDE